MQGTCGHIVLTSPNDSIPPRMLPQACAISPRNIHVPSNVIITSRAPRNECIRDLL